jgi:tetratricopeptide (TPR) repeat protein
MQDRKKDATRLIGQAVAAAHDKQLPEAIALLDQVLSTKDLETDLQATALFNRGVVHSTLNQPEKAFVDFSSMLALPGVRTSSKVSALSARAVILGKNKQFDEAIVDLLMVADLAAPDSPAVKATLHNLDAFRRQRDQSDKVLVRMAGQTKSAVLSQAKRADVLFDRAMLLYQRGDWPCALADLKRVATDGYATPEQQGMALNNLGVIEAGRGDEAAAEDRYDKVIAMPNAGASARGNALNNKGLLLLKHEQAEAATHHFSEGLKIPHLPDDLARQLRINRSVALTKAMGANANARIIADYDALLADPGIHTDLRQRLHNQRGLLRLQNTDFEGAKTDFMAVRLGMELAGDQIALSFNNLGVLASQAGKNIEALEMFTKATSIPDCGPAALSKAHFNRGAILALLGQAQGAAVAYGNAIDTPGGEHHALVKARNNRAMLMINQGDFDAAMADVDAVLALPAVTQDQQAKAFGVRARIHFGMKHYEKVIQDVEKGLPLGGETGLRLLGALAKLRLGQLAEAKADLQIEVARPMTTQVAEQFKADLAMAAKDGVAQADVDTLQAALP